MKKSFGISIVLCVLLAASFSFAQVGGTINLKDLEGLSPEAQQEIIQKRLNALDNTITEKAINIDPEKAEKWAKIISNTIKTVCKDLSIEVNEFVKTPVGKVTMFLIVYKVIGDDIKRLVFACVGWSIMTVLLIFSIRYFHGSTKLETKDENGNVTGVQYIPKYKWAVDKYDASNAKIASACFHVGIFIASTIAAIVLVSV